MAEPAKKLQQRFTWQDYLSWPDDERWEIIAGEAFAMSPPMTRHQRIQADLLFALITHFRKGPCQVFGAPTGVKLSEEDAVEPDILVVCDPTQIKPTHIEGPPKLVIEILSPSSTAHDRIRKNRLYARAGVAEYWIITPFPSVVEVFALDGETYRLRHALGKEDTLQSPAFPDLSIPLAHVFTFPLEPGEEPPAVRERPSHYTVVN